MEAKHISCDELRSPSASYESFITQNLEFHNQRGVFEFCKRRRVKACFHGWVILSNHSERKISLWNPLTYKFIRLPTLTRKVDDSYEYCLSSSPDDQASVLLLLSHTTPTIFLYRLGRKTNGLKWTKISYAKEIRSLSGGLDECFLQYPTCCNGNVYAMTTNSGYRFVIQVDIEVEDKQEVISLEPFVEIPQALYTRFPTSNSCSMFRSYLKGSGIELFYIEVCFEDETRISGVSLFKLEVTSMKWEKIESLKNALFIIDLSTHSVFYKSLVASKIGGYVHVFDDVSNISYSFYVDDKTMSLSSVSCGAQKAQLSVWEMLESGLEVDHHELKQEEKEKDNEISIRSSESCLNVPFDILEQIMEHCVGVEYMNFRATCKRCYLAAPHIQWSNTTTLRRLQMYSVVSPWLMVIDNFKGVITFTDPISGDKYFIKTPREFREKYCLIYCSSYGWLLCRSSETWFFYNPFTRNTLQLPEPPCSLSNLCFSAPPDSLDCIVVGFTYLHVYYLHFGSQKPLWRCYNLGGDFHKHYHPIPTFIVSDVYVMFDKERIVAFRDMGKENFSRVTVVDKAPRTSNEFKRREYFLSSCDQQIFLVIVAKKEESVEVLKLIESRKKWEKVYGIGKYMIYISDSSCICLEAKLPQMKNKIYFARLLHKKDTEIKFYSLDTHRYDTFSKKHIEESFGVGLSDTENYCCHHTWIEPSWS